MMDGLISASEMEALRRIPLQGMTTPISILKRSTIERDGADPQTVWAVSEIINGWVWEVPEYTRGNTVGGVVGEAAAFRVYLPVGVDVEPGDQLGLDGLIYNVLNTNVANTYMPMLRVVVRRLE